jgi:hypothetical protein
MDETTANAPVTGATAQGTNQNSKSESEDIRKMMEQMASLAKQVNDQKQ